MSRTRYFAFGDKIQENWYYDEDEEDASDPHALKNLMPVVRSEDANLKIELRALLESQQEPTNSIFVFSAPDSWY